MTELRQRMVDAFVCHICERPLWSRHKTNR